MGSREEKNPEWGREKKGRKEPPGLLGPCTKPTSVCSRDCFLKTECDDANKVMCLLKPGQPRAPLQLLPTQRSWAPLHSQLLPQNQSSLGMNLSFFYNPISVVMVGGNELGEGLKVHRDQPGIIPVPGSRFWILLHPRDPGLLQESLLQMKTISFHSHISTHKLLDRLGLSVHILKMRAVIPTQYCDCCLDSWRVPRLVEDPSPPTSIAEPSGHRISA